MTWIYLLKLIPKKMKSKPPPLFQFFMATIQTTVVTRTVPGLRKKMGGTISNYLYRDKVVTCIVTLARPSLMMHTSDRHADVTMPVATNNAHHYCGLRPVATNFKKQRF
jgi:hypothetical protein